MKKYLTSLLVLGFFFVQFASGQSSVRQAGIRTGYRGGFFFQTTADAGNAGIGYNAMVGFNNNGVQFTGLKLIYETNIPSISPDLYFAWGYGGHAGFIVTDHISYFGERYNFENDRFCPLIGVDGWISMDYRFREIPLVISVNIKPYVEVTMPAFVKIMPADIGISISYVF